MDFFLALCILFSMQKYILFQNIKSFYFTQSDGQMTEFGYVEFNFIMLSYWSYILKITYFYLIDNVNITYCFNIMWTFLHFWNSPWFYWQRIFKYQHEKAYFVMFSIMRFRFMSATWRRGIQGILFLAFYLVYTLNILYIVIGVAFLE